MSGIVMAILIYYHHKPIDLIIFLIIRTEATFITNITSVFIMEYYDLSSSLISRHRRIFCHLLCFRERIPELYNFCHTKWIHE
jgi:hypothetical protein